MTRKPTGAQEPATRQCVEKSLRGIGRGYGPLQEPLSTSEAPGLKRKGFGAVSEKPTYQDVAATEIECGHIVERRLASFSYCYLDAPSFSGPAGEGSIFT